MDYRAEAAGKTVRTTSYGLAIHDAKGFFVASMRFNDQAEAEAFGVAVLRMAQAWKDENESKEEQS